jgi:hypothetical protein
LIGDKPIHREARPLWPGFFHLDPKIGPDPKISPASRPGLFRLKQVPRKLIDFYDENLLQHFDFARLPVVRTIPFERKAR